MYSINHSINTQIGITNALVYFMSKRKQPWPSEKEEDSGVDSDLTEEEEDSSDMEFEELLRECINELKELKTILKQKSSRPSTPLPSIKSDTVELPWRAQAETSTTAPKEQTTLNGWVKPSPIEL